MAHADVRRWCLFHHDPSQDDAAIDAKLAAGRTALAELGAHAECDAPAEGETIEL